MTPSPWFQRLCPHPEAHTRLFCFHHAGGSAAAYRTWPRLLPEFDVVAVQLPGRANRLLEEPVASFPALVEALLPALEPLLDRPFAFFGHSMGTALAWALARRLHESGARSPVHVFASGRQPPHKPFAEESLRTLNDAQLLQRIASRYGGFPPEALAHPELLELVLPPLRADFAALEGHSPAPGEPLPIPITVLGGLDDPCAARERLAAWQACSREPLRWQMLPGHHFYIDQHAEAIAACIRETLVPGAGRRAA